MATSNQLVWKGECASTYCTEPDYLTHVYEGNEWFEGGNNQYPTNISHISSFDALDAAIAYVANKKKFPMINHVVLAGHSAGGQSKRLHLIRIQVSDQISSRSTICHSRQRSSTRGHSAIHHRQRWFLRIFFPPALQTYTR